MPDRSPRVGAGAPTARTRTRARPLGVRRLPEEPQLVHPPRHARHLGSESRAEGGVEDDHQVAVPRGPARVATSQQSRGGAVSAVSPLPEGRGRRGTSGRAAGRVVDLGRATAGVGRSTSRAAQRRAGRAATVPRSGRRHGCALGPPRGLRPGRAQQGSGTGVPLAGDGQLKIVLTGISMPGDVGGQHYAGPRGPVLGRTGVVEDLYVDNLFEGAVRDLRRHALARAVPGLRPRGPPAGRRGHRPPALIVRRPVRSAASRS